MTKTLLNLFSRKPVAPAPSESLVTAAQAAMNARMQRMLAHHMGTESPRNEQRVA
jgi:hypothetical protein